MLNGILVNINILKYIWNMNKIIYLSLVTVIYLLIGIFIINVISDHPFTQLLDPYILEITKWTEKYLERYN